MEDKIVEWCGRYVAVLASAREVRQANSMKEAATATKRTVKETLVSLAFFCLSLIFPFRDSRKKERLLPALAASHCKSLKYKVSIS